MDLVSNFIGGISPNTFGINNIGVASNAVSGDKTFADMLEEQINKQTEQSKISITDNSLFPNGVYIGDFDGPSPAFDVQTSNKADTIKHVNEFENADMSNYKDVKDMSSSEILTFFKSIFDNKPTITDTSNSKFFEFERKIAANQYSKYSRNIVTNLGEFVSDAIKHS